MNILNYINERYLTKIKLFNSKQTMIGIKLIILNIFIILLISKYQKKTDKQKNIIPIVFSINDNYAYPLIVLLTSILYNSSPKTFFLFYILISPDLKEIKLKKIFGLQRKYKNYKNVTIYMGEKFSKFNSGRYKTAAVYYRLAISDLII